MLGCLQGARHVAKSLAQRYSEGRNGRICIAIYHDTKAYISIMYVHYYAFVKIMACQEHHAKSSHAVLE